MDHSDAYDNYTRGLYSYSHKYPELNAAEATFGEFGLGFARFSRSFVFTNLDLFSYSDFLIDAYMIYNSLNLAVLDPTFYKKNKALLRMFKRSEFRKVITSIGIGLERLYDYTPLLQHKELEKIWEFHDYFMTEFLKEYGKLGTFIVLYKSDDFFKWFEEHIIDPVIEWWIKKPISALFPVFHKILEERRKHDVLNKALKRPGMWESYFKQLTFKLLAPYFGPFVIPAIITYKALGTAFKLLGTTGRLIYLMTRAYKSRKKKEINVDLRVEHKKLDYLSFDHDKINDEFAELEKKLDNIKDERTKTPLSTAVAVHKMHRRLVNVGRILYGGFKYLWLNIAKFAEGYSFKVTRWITKATRSAVSALMIFIRKIFKWAAKIVWNITKSFFNKRTIAYVSEYAPYILVGGGIVIDAVLLGKLFGQMAEVYNLFRYQQSQKAWLKHYRELYNISYKDVFKQFPSLKNVDSLYNLSIDLENAKSKTRDLLRNKIEMKLLTDELKGHSSLYVKTVANIEAIGLLPMREEHKELLKFYTETLPKIRSFESVITTSVQNVNDANRLQFKYIIHVSKYIHVLKHYKKRLQLRILINKLRPLTGLI